MKIYTSYKPRYDYLIGSIVKVRFADINAPELDIPRGELAKEVLKKLIDYYHVFLDIDDKYVYDRYGRIIAVVYLPLNETIAL